MTREVRWFYTGVLPRPIRSWFELSTASTFEERIDVYDLASARNGIGRKHRNNTTLDTKFRVEVMTDVELAPGVIGQVEDWMKTTEPLLGLPSQQLADPLPVTKRLQTGLVQLTGNGESGCEVELVEIEVNGIDAWSLCFETFGAPESRTLALDVATRTFFSGARLPGKLELTQSSSLSYPEWIGRLAFQTA